MILAHSAFYATMHFAWPCQGSIHIYYSRLHIVHFFYRRSVCVVPNTTSLSVGSGAKGWSIYTKAIMINSTLKTSLVFQSLQRFR